jgi:capsular polysaccharide biosynthesis protein
MMLNLPRLYDFSRERSGVEFIELEAPSVRVPQAPRFFFGTFTGQLSESYFKLTHLHQIGVFVCKNTEIRAPYLITRDGAVMACPQANLHEAHLLQFLSNGGAATGQRSLRIGGACAMVFGPGYRIFGHWMIDFLPKLYLLQRAGYDWARTSFLLPSDCPSFGYELLELLGIKHDRIVQFDVQTESVFCECLLVPTTCHNGLLPAHLFRENIGWVRGQIEARNGPLNSDQKAERLFVSRGHRAAGNRALVNREEIEAIAVAHGFKLIYPEEISLFKQFGIFSQAKEIIGEYGSALHSAMFSPPETIVCALRGDSVHPGFVQSAIAEALGHHMGYVIGTNIPDKWDFIIEPENFATTLHFVFGGASLGVPGINKTAPLMP